MTMRAETAVAKYGASIETYEALAAKAAGTINELVRLEGVNFHSVTHRTKSVASFREKLQRKSYDDPLRDVTDLAGIRVICYVETDVERVCDVIRAEFAIDADHSGDKSEVLKADQMGYRSVHFVARFSDDRLALKEYGRFRDLVFEIQIRTILQHAWAEIEHDRNYKFSGVLPDALKRRFALLAGQLELADREFEALSRDIDDYSKEVLKRAEAGEFDIPLSTSALTQYLLLTFADLVDEGVSPEYAGQSDLVIDELRAFGVENLEQLNALITDDVRSGLKGSSEDNTTFLGVVRDIMLLADAERYFEKAWKNRWNGLDSGTATRLRRAGVDVEDLANRFGVFIIGT